MAQKTLIMGQSGTGKSTSIRNCNPANTAIVNPVGKPLPFKGRFEMLNGVTESRKIVQFMKDVVAAGKKIIVVDDFQYILSIPYMNRINEAGWDKWNDFGANYFEIIDICNKLPDDVRVYYLTHTETLEDGTTTIKLIGKLLREKITIEGLFTIVLRTGVNEGKYYFYTQNSGKDTVKSPMGMFPAYAIENDLQYVDDKICSYYEIGADFKSDAEMQQADQAVADTSIEKPTAGRRVRGGAKTNTAATPEQPARRTRAQVEADNKSKMEQYQSDVNAAIDKIADGRKEIPFEEAAKAADSVQKPDLEQLPRKRRTRGAAQEGGYTDNTDSRTVVLEKDTYFYRPSDNNYLMKRKGDSVDLVVGGETVLVEITKEEFGEGIKAIAQGKEVPNIPDGTDEPPLPMNPPEEGAPKVRQRRNRTADSLTQAETPATAQEAPTSGRRRRTR